MFIGSLAKCMRMSPVKTAVSSKYNDIRVHQWWKSTQISWGDSAIISHLNCAHPDIHTAAVRANLLVAFDHLQRLAQGSAICALIFQTVCVKRQSCSGESTTYTNICGYGVRFRCFSGDLQQLFWHRTALYWFLLCPWRWIHLIINVSLAKCFHSASCVTLLCIAYSLLPISIWTIRYEFYVPGSTEKRDSNSKCPTNKYTVG